MNCNSLEFIHNLLNINITSFINDEKSNKLMDLNTKSIRRDSFLTCPELIHFVCDIFGHGNK